MSCNHCSTFLSEKIEEFMQEMQEDLEDFDESEFQEIIESILIEITAKFNNLDEENKYYWREIQTHEFLFDRSKLLSSIKIIIIINRRN